MLSPAYLGSAFGEAEWRAAFLKDPSGELGRLVPVRVQECEPPGLLASLVYIDLVDVGEEKAQRRLLAGVDQSGARPTTAPFPGAVGRAKRFPGQGPAVSNLPARNRNFSGRDELLEQLHASLQAESAAAVVPTGAVRGLGGVGKTQLALEFAHRFASDYDMVWWVPAELPPSATAALAALAGRPGVDELADQGEMVAGLFDLLRQPDRWLMVYDNAERPDRLVGLLPPGGGGHVLVTSRWSAWGGHADSLELNVLHRNESITFLSKRTGSDDQTTLDALAATAAGWGLRFRPRSDARAWPRGAAGERRTARLLSPLERHGWAVLHDLPDPGVVVVPIVAVHGAQVPWGMVVAQGVPVVAARRLPAMLCQLPAVLGPERVAVLADQARVRFHAAA